MTRSGLSNWLMAPPFTGNRALFWVMIALSVPTVIRVAVDGAVTGTGFIPYIPFVLLSAIFLALRFAILVALAAATIADAIFVGPPYKLLEGPTDIFGMAVFLTASALIIGFVHAIRKLIVEAHGRATATKPTGGIVFSLEDGQAWASWYGRNAPVHLGAEQEVAEMMEDFLAQIELGKHLSRQNGSSVQGG